MEHLFSEALQALTRLYSVILNIGYIGCFFAFSVGLICNKHGEAMAKRNARDAYSGSGSEVGADLEYQHPTVEGAAKESINAIISTSLILLGSFLILLALFAFVNILCRPASEQG